jgi:hypothetical protein
MESMPVVIARLLFIFVAALGVWAVLRLVRSIERDARGGVRKRNGQSTYQPSKQSDAQTETASTGTPFVMSRQQVRGLRDALTSASINPKEPLACCGQCKSLYHQSSLEALRASHQTSCVTCGSTDLSAVLFSD